MSEPATDAADQQPAGEQSAPESEKTFSQADVDRIVRERLSRENVSELKAKARQFDQLQESSKTELQKLTEQVAELTAAQQVEAAKAMRYRIAAASGISTEDADLFLTGTDEETIAAQAKRLAERGQQARQQGGYAPNEGRQPPNQPDERRAFVRQLTGRS